MGLKGLIKRNKKYNIIIIKKKIGGAKATGFALHNANMNFN